MVSDDTKRANLLVSVILPVCNGEMYLVDAMDSVLAQSFSGFELIVIDDGSTDGSLAILQQYQKRDGRIRLVTRESRGLAATLNELIDLARGRWIARMDCDDIALPQRFERQLQWLEQTGADICGSWARYFGSVDRRVVRHPQTDQAIKMALLFGAPFVHPSVMMKSSLAKRLRYDQAWDKAEDYDLWERAARAGWKMTNVPEVLLLYRQHATKISTQSSSQQLILTQKIRRRYWRFVLDSMELDHGLVEEVLKIREPSSPNPNMDHVDYVFTELLKRNHGESRVVIFDHVTRLYFRIAANCPDIVVRWSKLNKNYGVGFAFGTKLKLWFLRAFRIRSDSSLFHSLRKIHFYLSR